MGAVALGAVGERLARHQLRQQMGRLERELGHLVAEGFCRVEIDHRLTAPAHGPRLLDLGELERLRDELAARVADARAALARRAERETASRELLRRMLADPAGHRWVKVTRQDVGEPGCGAWHSRPVLGPLGMLMGWWRVKVSSGCPLAGRLGAVERKAQAEGAPTAPAGRLAGRGSRRLRRPSPRR
ncbi:MAG: hypothetical protein ACM3NV_02910 [Syntrophothermus sp.]